MVTSRATPATTGGNYLGPALSERDLTAPPSTLTDVARLAGVSPSTVSRILNGTARVADDKRRAVMAAIEKMNFAPNQMAQALKKGRSMTIGILVQDFASPFFDETLRGVDDGLKDTGYASVIVSGHWNENEEIARIRMLLARKIDGIIVVAGRIGSDAIMHSAAHCPIVATARAIESPRAHGFKLDHEHGAWLAMTHLLALGHTRIAFISGPDDHEDAQARLAGYRRALDEAGIAFDARLVARGDFHEAAGMAAVGTLLAGGRPFSAIFAANDLSAYGARLGLYRKGIRVPEDVSLVGFDDLPASAYATPPLTTVRQPLYAMGRIATASLLQLINGKAVSGELPPLELVVRETTRRLG